MTLDASIYNIHTGDGVYIVDSIGRSQVTILLNYEKEIRTMKKLIEQYRTEVEKVNTAIKDAEIAIADLEVKQAELLTKQEKAVKSLDLEQIENLSKELDDVESAIKVKKDSIKKFESLKNVVADKYVGSFKEYHNQSIKDAQKELMALETELIELLKQFEKKYKQFRAIEGRVNIERAEINRVLGREVFQPTFYISQHINKVKNFLSNLKSRL